jgi:hypothetical protein
VTAEPIFRDDRLVLGDVISTLLDKGVVLKGEALLSVADIDLINLDLGVMLVAVETMLRRGKNESPLASRLGPPVLSPERAGRVRSGEETAVARPGLAPRGETTAALALPTSTVTEAPLREVAPALPERINVDPEKVENGLARLALTLIEVLRKVLEHQAIRRMEGGSLSEQEVERLGFALLRLHDRMQELKNVFGLSDEDLEIDLGPLGRVR